MTGVQTCALPIYYLEQELLDLKISNEQEKRELQIIKYLHPLLLKDGNQWCYVTGNLPEKNCIVGFGDTPEKAMREYCSYFSNIKVNTKESTK